MSVLGVGTPPIGCSLKKLRELAYLPFDAGLIVGLCPFRHFPCLSSRISFTACTALRIVNPDSIQLFGYVQVIADTRIAVSTVLKLY
jgi:hypothetical protein